MRAASLADGASSQAEIAENLATAVTQIVAEIRTTTVAFEDVATASHGAQAKAVDGGSASGKQPAPWIASPLCSPMPPKRWASWASIPSEWKRSSS